jgi:hypothetical protein
MDGATLTAMKTSTGTAESMILMMVSGERPNNGNTARQLCAAIRDEGRQWKLAGYRDLEEFIH